MYRYPLGSVRPFFRHTTCFRILSLNSARQPLCRAEWELLAYARADQRFTDSPFMAVPFGG